ncbi:MAG: putative mycofactocin biosynthesis glycosyltransferase MftF [candidate division WS2 bacterium]|nr:putative mycofactocin biosynthesis glycosyltransferase MftF [Candidatus Psychracetigena formicireducens]
MEVSIIIPTKNNGDILEKCLISIENLDHPKEDYEVIVVDGHSTDNTVEIAKRYGCKIVYEDIGKIGGARNIGVKVAKGEYIAFTDSDCVVDKNWLKSLIEQFNDEKIASVGGPNITPEDDTEFAKCAGEVLTFLSNPGPRYGFNVDKVMAIYHNPTCNSAYRKSIFQEVGMFNPTLITCDDEELDYRIKEKGYKILFTPHANVLHYRRPTWKKFAKMAFCYGIGRTQVIKLHRDMGRWYHYTPPMLILTIVILFALTFLNPILPLIASLILVIGGVGIGVMSLYLGAKTEMTNFLTYCALIAIWFWGYGFGMFRGLAK